MLAMAKAPVEFELSAGAPSVMAAWPVLVRVIACAALATPTVLVKLAPLLPPGAVKVAEIVGVP